MKELTIDSLLTGMILKVKNGPRGEESLAMVLKGTINGDIISGETWMPLESLFLSSSSEILEVWQPTSNMVYLNNGEGSVVLTLDSCTLVWSKTMQSEEHKLEKDLDEINAQLVELNAERDKKVEELVSLKNLDKLSELVGLWYSSGYNRAAVIKRARVLLDCDLCDALDYCDKNVFN